MSCARCATRYSRRRRNMESSFNAELSKAESELNAAVEGKPQAEADAAGSNAEEKVADASPAPAALEGQPKT